MVRDLPRKFAQPSGAPTGNLPPNAPNYRVSAVTSRENSALRDPGKHPLTDAEAVNLPTFFVSTVGSS